MIAEQLALLSEQGVVDRNRDAGEADVARQHESAQTMAHGGSAGGVSTYPPMNAISELIARAEQSQAWVTKFLTDRDEDEEDVSGVYAAARRHMQRMDAAIARATGEQA